MTSTNLSIPVNATRRATFFLLPVFAAALHASAQITTIDFEGLPAMANSPNSPVPAADQLSNQLLTTSGILFSSESSSPFVAIVNLGTGTSSGVNGLGGVSSGGLLSYATPFGIAFFIPQSPSTFAATDFVSIRGDTVPLGSGSVTLQAYDVFGNLLASDTQIDDHPVTLSVTHADIHSIRLIESSGTVAFDDLRFGPLVAVPEPGSIVLIGLGGLALLLRRKRQELLNE